MDLERLDHLESPKHSQQNTFSLKHQICNYKIRNENVWINAIEKEKGTCGALRQFQSIQATHHWFRILRTVLSLIILFTRFWPDVSSVDPLQISETVFVCLRTRNVSWNALQTPKRLKGENWTFQKYFGTSKVISGRLGSEKLIWWHAEIHPKHVFAALSRQNFLAYIFWKSGVFRSKNYQICAKVVWNVSGWFWCPWSPNIF